MAAATVKATIQGMEELSKLLKLLPGRVQKKVLRKAIVAASSPIVKQARANAPVRFGFLKRSVGRKVKTYRTGNVVAVIGAKRGSGNSRHEPANYSHLVERGTRPHQISKGAVIDKVLTAGKPHPGAKPKPFLKPAFDANVQSSTKIAGNVLAAGIEAEARKLK
jgi:HK97 gp10 family phage protein